jgi:hypothetical protein
MAGAVSSGIGPSLAGPKATGKPYPPARSLGRAYAARCTGPVEIVRQADAASCRLP